MTIAAAAAAATTALPPPAVRAAPPLITRDSRPLDTLPLAMLPTGRLIDPTTNELPDPNDTRPEDKRPKLVPEHKIDEEIAGRVRQILAACEVKDAEGIVELGCTGLSGWGVHIDNMKLVRNGLAGSGVGLTCYVGPDRYCLVHETIGGLQDGQAQRHAEFVEKISRPLTEKERLSVSLTETARRIQNPQRMTDAVDALTGRRVGDDFLRDVVAGAVAPEAERVLDPAPAAPVPAAPAFAVAAAMPPSFQAPPLMSNPLAPGVALLTPALIRYDCAACGAVYPWPIPGVPEEMQPKERRCTRCFALPNDAEKLFKCPEHTTTAWNCRYCIAATIAAGDYAPALLLAGNSTYSTPHPPEPVDAAEVDAKVANYAAINAVTVEAELYVRVARWERKLTRT